MSDPFVERTLRLLGDILGLNPVPTTGGTSTSGLTPDAPKGVRKPDRAFRSVAETPPALERIEDPMRRLAQDEQREMREMLAKPGAKVFDTIPSERLTEAEHKAMRDALNDQGKTYRPGRHPIVPLSAFPKDTLFPGPLR